MYQRIVVPLDGSDLAELALPEAEQLARLTGAPIHLVRVVDLPRVMGYGQFGMSMDYVASEQAIASDGDAATRYLHTVAERITAAGLTATTEVLRGPTSRVLVDATQPGDLVVMASHGRSGMTRWFLGSVAEEILRHAEVPVLLVKAGEAAATQSRPEALTAVAV